MVPLDLFFLRSFGESLIDVPWGGLNLSDVFRLVIIGGHVGLAVHVGLVRPVEHAAKLAEAIATKLQLARN